MVMKSLESKGLPGDINLTARENTYPVNVGGVQIGGSDQVVVQSMTDTDTADIVNTVNQVKLLSDAGSELVRVTVNNAAAPKAVFEISKRLADLGCTVPLVGDFHFIGHRLLRDYPNLASTLSKFRINPGNVGRGSRHDENFAAFIEIAKDLGKAVRIGVNAGSLDPDVMAAKMDENSRLKEPLSSEKVENQALVDSALASSEAALDLSLIHI